MTLLIDFHLIRKNDDNKGIYKNIFHKVGNNTGVSLNTIHGVNKQYAKAKSRKLNDLHVVLEFYHTFSTPKWQVCVTN